MWPNPQFPVDLVTFTEEILNGKLHFFAMIGEAWPDHKCLKSVCFHKEYWPQNYRNIPDSQVNTFTRFQKEAPEEVLSVNR